MNGAAAASTSAVAHARSTGGLSAARGRAEIGRTAYQASFERMRTSRRRSSPSAAVTRSPAPTGGRRLSGDPFLAQLGERAVGLLEPVQALRPQHVRGLRELDLPVVDDLDEVAPRVMEIEATPGDRHPELAEA